jgi:hypothetical protein
MNSKFTRETLSVFVAIIVFVFLGGYYWLSSPVVTQKRESQNWKTYQSEKLGLYGFRVDYPENWVIQSSDGMAVSGARFWPEGKRNTFATVGIIRNTNYFINKVEYPITQEYIDSSIDAFKLRVNDFSIEDINISGFAAKKMSGVDNGQKAGGRLVGTRRIEIILKIGDEVFYVITYSSKNGDYEEEFNNMMASFTVTDLYPFNKIYSNEEYGFEMKYPSSLKSVEWSSPHLFVLLTENYESEQLSAMPTRGASYEVERVRRAPPTIPDDFVSARCAYLAIGSPKLECKQSTFLGLAAAEVIRKRDGHIEEKMIFIEIEGEDYLIFKVSVGLPAQENQGFIDLYDQIISTFRFVEP